MGFELGAVLFTGELQSRMSIHENGCNIAGRKERRFGGMRQVRIMLLPCSPVSGIGPGGVAPVRILQIAKTAFFRTSAAGLKTTKMSDWEPLI